MLEAIITELSYLTRQILSEFWLGAELARFTSGKKRPQPAPPGCGLSTSATAWKQPRGSQLLTVIITNL